MSEEPKLPEVKPELKTERVQLLMSPSEVKAVDDYGFSHRIRTRAQVIRHLILEGMVTESAEAYIELLTEVLTDFAKGEPNPETIYKMLEASDQYMEASKKRLAYAEELSSWHETRLKHLQDIINFAEKLEEQLKEQQAKEADYPERE